ncbi:MAG: hypothetical protein ABI895_29195 [Deltaproteobacteria bacterium]
MMLGILLLGSVVAAIVLLVACLPLIKYLAMGVVLIAVYAIGVDRVEGWLKAACDAFPDPKPPAPQYVRESSRDRIFRHAREYRARNPLAPAELAARRRTAEADRKQDRYLRLRFAREEARDLAREEALAAKSRPTLEPEPEPVPTEGLDTCNSPAQALVRIPRGHIAQAGRSRGARGPAEAFEAQARPLAVPRPETARSVWRPYGS